MKFGGTMRGLNKSEVLALAACTYLGHRVKMFHIIHFSPSAPSVESDRTGAVPPGERQSRRSLFVALTSQPKNRNKLVSKGKWQHANLKTPNDGTPGTFF